jgi:hypothetical protein
MAKARIVNPTPIHEKRQVRAVGAMQVGLRDMAMDTHSILYLWLDGNHLTRHVKAINL